MKNVSNEKEIIRTFIAIEIPEEIKARMVDIQADLRKSGAQVGWVRPEGVHLTLKFLGDMEAGRIDELGKAIESAVSDIKPFALEAKGIGVFPTARAPRVVWLGLVGDLDTLAALYERVEAAAEGLGFRREDRPFKPHLTLGRVKSPGGRDALMRLVSGHEKAELGSFTADAVSVMKSELKPAGAVYTEIRRIPLAG
jgi:2'-5' RNA ligase